MSKYSKYTPEEKQLRQRVKRLMKEGVIKEGEINLHKKSDGNNNTPMENEVLDQAEYSLAELQKDQAEGMKELKKKKKYSKYTPQQKAMRRAEKLGNMKTKAQREAYLNRLTQAEKKALAQAIKVKKVMNESISVRGRPKKASKYTPGEKAKRRAEKISKMKLDSEKSRYFHSIPEGEREAVLKAVDDNLAKSGVFEEDKPIAKRKKGPKTKEEKKRAAAKSERGWAKSWAKKRSAKKRKTDLGRNEERMLEGRLHMLDKNGKITRKVIGRVGRTDPTHWKSGTASKNWKRYTKDSKVPWQRTSRMNTDLSYRYSHWPPAKFIREDYLVVPYVRCMQHGNPYMKGKRLIEYEKNGKRYHRVANASTKKKSKK